MPIPFERKTGFNVFQYNDEVTVSRIGKRVQVKGRDGTFTESDAVEANLLYEILKQLKKSK